MVQNPHLKGRIMNTATTKATAIATVTIAIIAFTSASSAFALPYPGEPGASPTALQTDAPCGVATTSGDRLLRRIGTQFVRGDDLTGAGVPAPAWVTEAQ